MEVPKLRNQPRLLQEIFNQNVKRLRQLIAEKEDVNWQDADGRSLLFAAAYVGNAEIADALILSGARVNKKDLRWNTPLGYACRNQKSEIVELLLIHETEVNSRNRNWQVPLHICAANNAVRCAEYILPRLRNEVDISDRQGRTACHWACHSGSIEMVELLMEYGANLNVTDKRNRRPLHYACHRGNIDLVEFLLRNGADTTAKDRDGLRPVAYAAVADHDGVVKAIFDFEIEKFGSPTSLHFTSDRGESLIHLTVANGNINVCESLLSYGADVNLRNSTNLLTPLMVACTSTRASPLALLLLHNGADLKLKSADGRTALHFMAANDVWSLISTMIKYGANVNSKDNRGLTPLHTAALSGHQKCVRKLLDLKAEVNCSSNVGQTALHFAVYEGQEDVIQLLLENNANVQLVDNFDRSVLHYACMGGKITPKTLEQLIYKGADIFGLDNCYRSSLHYACLSGNEALVTVLIEKGAEIKTADSLGRQPLHYAAYSDFTSKCCDLLLKNGADSRVFDRLGFTPLFYASVSGHPVTVEMFLKLFGHYETEKIKRAKFSISALHIAAYAGHPKTVALLLNYGADVDLKTSDGQTPLFMAVRQNNLTCISHLVNAGANIWESESKSLLNSVHLAASFGLTAALRVIIADCHPSSMPLAEGLQLVDRNNRDALMLAVSSRNLETFIYLLTQGAVATNLDKSGRSTLHRAAALGMDKASEILIEKGANIMGAAFATGRTAFHYCCQRGESRVLSVLLNHTPADRNLNPNWLDTRGFSPLQWAAYSGSEACVELLLWEIKATERPSFCPFSALHCAAASGSQICLQLLLESGCEDFINAVDGSGRTPLHIAAQSGSFESVQLILGKPKADLDAQDRWGQTALTVAVKCGFDLIVDFLLKMGADANQADINGNTALHHACKHRLENVANLLLATEGVGDAGLINRQNSDMRTALHIAARSGMVLTVEQLLLKGADLYLRDKNDLTPALACAIDENVADCLALIMTVQNLEPLNNPPTPTAIAPPLSGRLSFSHTQLTELLKRGRSRGSDPLMITKEPTSSHSSDSEFY